MCTIFIRKNKSLSHQQCAENIKFHLPRAGGDIKGITTTYEQVMNLESINHPIS